MDLRTLLACVFYWESGRCRPGGYRPTDFTKSKKISVGKLYSHLAMTIPLRDTARPPVMFVIKPRQGNNFDSTCILAPSAQTKYVAQVPVLLAAGDGDYCSPLQSKR